MRWCGCGLGPSLFSLLSAPLLFIMSPSAASRRRKNNQIMYRYRDHCKFMQCATQLDNGDSSADYVRVMRCVREQDTNAPSKPDEASKEHSSSITKFRKNEIVELQQPPHAAEAATTYKSDARTMIITTTSFTSIPMKPLHTQNAIYVKPLIVLDLNGILCHRIRESKQSAMTNTRYKTSLGRIANTEVIPRSDLTMFLQLLNSHFTLAVWTSATSKTAKGLVKMLFPEEIRKVSDGMPLKKMHKTSPLSLRSLQIFQTPEEAALRLASEFL